MDSSCCFRMECLSNEIHDHICPMRALSKEERDMYIMGKLKSRSAGSVSSRHDAKRQRYEYSFDDREVCKDAFLFLHLMKHTKTNGIRPRTHGNSGKKPHNALFFEEIKFVMQFIKIYSEDNDLSMPAAPRGRDTEPPTFLPCSNSKRDIHDMYAEACQEVSISAVKLSSFYSIWSACLPNLQIATPRADICNTCERHREHILDARSENEKLTITRNFTYHVEKPDKEHKRYIQCIKEAREEHQSLQHPEPDCRPCSSDFLKAHYTFDFAQCVSIPHHSRQVGLLFFETLRKIQIFGICMEGSGSQYNYLIDQDQTIGEDGKNAHGPNTVISILHHHCPVSGQEHGLKGHLHGQTVHVAERRIANPEAKIIVNMYSVPKPHLPSYASTLKAPSTKEMSTQAGESQILSLTSVNKTNTSSSMTEKCSRSSIAASVGASGVAAQKPAASPTTKSVAANLSDPPERKTRSRNSGQNKSSSHY